MQVFDGDDSLLNYATVDVILTLECRTATKNKNVFGAVIFNIAKVGAILELLITSIVRHKNKNR